MGSFASAVFYLIVFAFSSLLFQSGIKLKQPLIPTMLALFPLVLLAGLRYGVGTDYFTYLARIENISHASLREIFSVNIFESAFVLLERLASGWGHRFHFAIVAFLTLFPVIVILIKDYRFKIHSLSLFLFLIFYFTYSLNLSRQIVAVSIAFWGYRFIFKQNIFKFVLLLLLASLFHTTAIFLFPLYFLWKPGQGIVKSRAIVMLLSLVIIAGNFQIFLIWLSNYTGFERFGNYALANPIGQNRELFLSALVFLFILFHRKALIKLDVRYDFFIVLLLMALVINTTGNVIPYVKRMSFYFDIGQVLLLPAIPLVYQKDRKLFMIGIMFFYAITYFFLVFFILGHAHIIPYKI